MDGPLVIAGVSCVFTSCCFLFFFSSRRRHTRLVSDWSSDVCSSDLIDFSSTATPPARPDAFGPPQQDEGPSDFDIRHKVSISGNWKIPGPPSGIARGVLGGWQIAGVLIAQSGAPFTVVCNGRSFTPVRDAAGNIVGN